ncbi:hypothetical protein C4580_05195 [Candidatus Woesearchaeota archaeon]|nr:MAG: hypothetical protein C4580_05195 [Candidatus Woesearchaeota archaeon]
MQDTNNVPLSEWVNIKIRSQKVPKTKEHPIGIDFAVIGQILTNGEWENVVQIDNSAHEGKTGTHIHYLDKRIRTKRIVRDKELIVSPEQAYDEVKKHLEKQYAHLIEKNQKNENDNRNSNS